jgi:hypothetical protein
MHVCVEDDEVNSELIAFFVGPDDGLDYVVNDVGVHHEAKAHAGQSEGRFVGVVWSYISVADLTHCVDSPV